MAKLVWIGNLPRVAVLLPSCLNEIERELKFAEARRRSPLGLREKKIKRYKIVEKDQSHKERWKISVQDFEEPYLNDWKRSEGGSLKEGPMAWTDEQVKYVASEVAKPLDIYIWPDCRIIFVRDFPYGSLDLKASMGKLQQEAYGKVNGHVIHLFNGISKLWGVPLRMRDYQEYPNFDATTIKKITSSLCKRSESEYEDIVVNKMQQIVSSVQQIVSSDKPNLLAKFASKFAFIDDFRLYRRIGREKADLDDRIRIYNFLIPRLIDFAQTQNYPDIAKNLEFLHRKITGDQTSVNGIKPPKKPLDIFLAHWGVFLSSYFISSNIAPWIRFALDEPLRTVNSTNIPSFIFGLTGLLFLALELILGPTKRRRS